MTSSGHYQADRKWEVKSRHDLILKKAAQIQQLSIQSTTTRSGTNDSYCPVGIAQHYLTLRMSSNLANLNAIYYGPLANLGTLSHPANVGAVPYLVDVGTLPHPAKVGTMWHSVNMATLSHPVSVGTL